MIIVLDTNVIMDALQERQPFDAEAKEILSRAQNGEFACCFTANTATDIFYLYRKARGLQSARQALNFLLAAYTVISVTHEDCLYAMKLPIEDFEDALVAMCAKKSNANYIVSRDAGFLRNNSPVEVIEPKDLPAKLTKRQENA